MLYSNFYISTLAFIALKLISGVIIVIQLFINELPIFGNRYPHYGNVMHGVKIKSGALIVKK